jgi:hypothetical protein
MKNAMQVKDTSPALAQDADFVALCGDLEEIGFRFVPAQKMEAWLRRGDAAALSDWNRFQQSWNDMPLDRYMADGGSYRRRRHATLSAAPSSRVVQLEPHQPHYQSRDYNPLNGGVARLYEPIAQDIIRGASMTRILGFCCDLFGRLAPGVAWHIEVHQFRIEASAAGAGKPTPEGVHRDGVNFVLVMMVQRVNIASGTTTIYDHQQRHLDSFTLAAPFDCALVDDERCMHGVTPVIQLAPARPAYRDVLVVTFRKK